MPPILQTLITLTIRILLRLLLLRQMALTIRNYFAHVINIILLILAWILFGVLVKNSDDLAA